MPSLVGRVCVCVCVCVCVSVCECECVCETLGVTGFPLNLFIFSCSRGPGRIHRRLVNEAGDVIEKGRRLNCCSRCDSSFP